MKCVLTAGFRQLLFYINRFLLTNDIIKFMKKT